MTTDRSGTPPWLRTGWATHKGRRPVNEDAILVDGSLLAVADGVGGAPRGDLASHRAVDAVDAAIGKPLGHPTRPTVASELTAALLLADEAVADLAREWDELRGTATTMCACYVYADDAHQVAAVVANVGDSRCYVLRRGRAEQVTTDQTLATRLAQAGRTDIGARASHIVTSVLGGPPGSDVTVHLHQLHLGPDDGIVLCTDGISDVLEPEDLVRIVLRDEPEPGRAAAVLVREAWEAGSRDNLSAVVARIAPRSGHGEGTAAGDRSDEPTQELPVVP